MQTRHVERHSGIQKPSTRQARLCVWMRIVHVCCRFWYVGRCPKVIFVSRGVSFFGNFTLTGLHLLFFVCYQALLCELVREINTKKYVLAFRYYKALLEQFIDYILLVQKYGYIATADVL